jgi:hypothetical protein
MDDRRIRWLSGYENKTIMEIIDCRHVTQNMNSENACRQTYKPEFGMKMRANCFACIKQYSMFNCSHAEIFSTMNVFLIISL